MMMVMMMNLLVIITFQAERANCESKLKRMEGKISNSRRSVDSVVCMISRVWMALMGGSSVVFMMVWYGWYECGISGSSVVWMA